MAEAAGLVLGVVGLAGVISAFKDVIDLCAMVIDSRGLGRDYEILSTKFDIERTILLQWARRTNLLHPMYDRRLDDATTQSSVLRILSCIRLILGDEASLKQRYGLRQSTAVFAVDTATSVSGPLMDTFFEEFEAFNLRIDQHNRTNNWSTKFRWVIRDKQRFESLVTEIAHFTTKLNEILPVTNGMGPWRAVTEHDLRGMGLNDLKIILEASVGHNTISESAQNAITFACQDRILRRLWFRTMDDRERAVAPAHAKTLQWALEPPEDDFPWDDLSHWLRLGSGIYWISGKAGSGKSTLTKYLYHNPQTRRLLAEWASGPYVLTKFFFWNLGTAEQKTQEGLSRAWLYQILSDNRSLIASTLPYMWKEVLNTENDVSLPSQSETMYAFQTLSENSSHVGKICFFIDGLDEFAGNYMDGIRFIQKLASQQNIKIVVSSRPIPDCVAAFENVPKLQLHHLTRSDIRAYVHDTIVSHVYMKGLIKLYPEEASEIIEDVVNKSSGVFLWVILACRSLLCGFAAYDRIAELRRRVYELPPELEEMFQHMLNKVEQRYREQGAQMLRLCYTKRQAEDSHDLCDMSALGMALLDEDRAAFETQSLDKRDMRRLCDHLAGRLRSRCGGLLELTPRNATGSNVSHCFCGALPEHDHDSQVDGRVDFMHRTVYEFLSQEDIWELPCLQMQVEDSDCTANLSLLGVSLARLSLSTGKDLPLREEQASHFLRDGIQWGAKSDRARPFDRRNIFWRLQAFLDQLTGLELALPLFLQLVKVHKHGCTPASSHAALVLALEAGAVNYVKSHPEFVKLAGPGPPTCGCLPALYHAIALPYLNGNVQRWGRNDRLGFLSQDMAALLLRSGGDPNIVSGSGETAWTPWEAWLAAIERTFIEDTGMLDIAGIAMMFLDAGANHENSVCNARSWVKLNFLRRDFPEVRRKGEELLQRLDNTYAATEPTSSGTPKNEAAHKIHHCYTDLVPTRPEHPVGEVGKRKAPAEDVTSEGSKRLRLSTEFLSQN